MKYEELRIRIRSNLFTPHEVRMYFPDETDLTVRMQLTRLSKRGRIFNIQRGLYCFDRGSVDPLVLAHYVYQPSYVSCESALHYYGMIPDVPQAVTSMSVTTTKTCTSQFGRFYYSKIKKELFWGYQTVSKDFHTGYFLLAHREKALLDFLYMRNITNCAELRLNLEDFNYTRYDEYKRHFPQWVQRVELPKL